MSLAKQNNAPFDFYKKTQPTMNEFLSELSDIQIKAVINGISLSRNSFKWLIQKIIFEQRVNAQQITRGVISKDTVLLNQIFDDIEYGIEDKNLFFEKSQNCNALEPNNQLNQKLCILTIEKIMDQTLLDHGYSKLTSTVITNFTVLEKQIFFNNDPNQEFVVIALPALSIYGGVNGIQSVINNGVYFVVYKKNY